MSSRSLVCQKVQEELNYLFGFNTRRDVIRFTPVVRTATLNLKPRLQDREFDICVERSDKFSDVFNIRFFGVLPDPIRYLDADPRIDKIRRADLYSSCADKEKFDGIFC
jgi:hypothetical protein